MLVLGLMGFLLSFSKLLHHLFLYLCLLSSVYRYRLVNCLVYGNMPALLRSLRKVPRVIQPAEPSTLADIDLPDDFMMTGESTPEPFLIYDSGPQESCLRPARREVTERV